MAELAENVVCCEVNKHHRVENNKKKRKSLFTRAHSRTSLTHPSVRNPQATLHALYPNTIGPFRRELQLAIM